MVATPKALTNAAQAASYFGHDAKQQRPGQADYYTDNREGPSGWTGKLAQRLGLAGEVRVQDLRAVLEGRFPGGTDLTRHGGKGKDGKVHRLPGTDLCLQAPKSVSIAALMLSDDRILVAHRAAVAETLSLMEREAQARVTRNGQTTHVTTASLLVAMAEHHTVRPGETTTKVAGLTALDPHLHTHCVVVNVTEHEGRLRALDNHFLFEQQMRAGAIYHSALAEHLRAMGYTPVFRSDGTFDIAEIPVAEIEARSKRRNEILAAAGEGATAAQRDVANQKTRLAKIADLSLSQLRAYWREDIAAAMPDWQQPEGDGVVRHPAERNQEAIEYARDHLFERSSAVSFDEFERTALAAGADGPTIRAALAEHADLIHGAQIEITTTKGRRKMVEAIVSRDALTRETEIIGCAHRGRGAVEAVNSDVFAVAQRMAMPDEEGRTLNPEQQAVATAILTTDSRFLAIQGVAGAGKTFTMKKAFDEARAASMRTGLKKAFDEARAAGYEVLGVAPTNKAAGELRAATGEGKTLDSFLASDVALGPASIVVLDEGGMVSTQDMHALMQRIETSGARLVMVGDTDQLKPVAAGDPFGLLQRAECLQVVELTQSTRAQSDLMRGVYKDLFAANTDSAFDKLKPRVVTDSAERHGEIARAYLEIDDSTQDQKGLTARDNTLILVGTNAARMEINARVREGLGLAGQGAHIDTLIAADATEAQLRRIDIYRIGQVIQAGEAIIDGQSLKVQARAGEQFSIVGVDYKAGILEFEHVSDNGRRFTLPIGRDMPRIMLYERERIELSAGDRVLMRANDKAAQVYNGDRGRVVAVDHERRAVTLEIGLGDNIKTVTLSDTGARLPMVNHGYAMTVHSSQGATVDTVLTDLSADRATNRNLMLVAATRARNAVLAWTSDEARTRMAVREAAVKLNATEVVAARATELAASAATTTTQEADMAERASTPEQQAVWDRENRERQEFWDRQDRERQEGWRAENRAQGASPEPEVPAPHEPDRYSIYSSADAEQPSARDLSATAAADELWHQGVGSYATNRAGETAGWRTDAGVQMAPSMRENAQRPSHLMLSGPDGEQTSFMTREGAIMTMDGNGDYQYDAERTIELRTRDPRQYQDLVEAAGGVIGLDGKACAWVDGEPRESAESQRIREQLEAEQRTANAVLLAGETLAEGRTSDGKTVLIQVHDGQHALVTIDQEGCPERAEELTADEADDLVDDLDLEPPNDRIDGDKLRSAAHDKIERGNVDRSEQDQRPRVTLERKDLRAIEAERSHAIGVATEQPERAKGQVQPQEPEREVAGNDELRAALDAQVEAAQQRAERERENSYSR